MSLYHIDRIRLQGRTTARGRGNGPDWLARRVEVSNDGCFPRLLPARAGRHSGPGPLSRIHTAAEAGAPVPLLQAAGRQRGAGVVIERLSRDGWPPGGGAGGL